MCFLLYSAQPVRRKARQFFSFTRLEVIFSRLIRRNSFVICFFFFIFKMTTDHALRIIIYRVTRTPSGLEAYYFTLFETANCAVFIDIRAKEIKNKIKSYLFASKYGLT